MEAAHGITAVHNRTPTINAGAKEPSKSPGEYLTSRSRKPATQAQDRRPRRFRPFVIGTATEENRLETGPPDAASTKIHQLTLQRLEVAFGCASFVLEVAHGVAPDLMLRG